MGFKKRPAKITSEDCLTCGLCCVAPTDQSSFCDVNDGDLVRLSPQWIRHNVEFWDPLTGAIETMKGNGRVGAIKTKRRNVARGPLKGCTAVSCSQLDGNPMHAVKCRIYNKRPDICKQAVKPGDSVCRAIRGAYKRLVEEINDTRHI